MRKLLEGRTALVIGGSRGIGKATAILFDEEGANLIVTGRSLETLQETVAAVEAVGGKALAVAADSADAAACTEAGVRGPDRTACDGPSCDIRPGR